ncbi:MAG: DNA repair protein RecN [Ruminiclostridium sp.]|nr:DNA repair protein RecN [Ruminiclostridium sp.]
MLKELFIENLAVIEKADIELGGRLNVFSGETGAGKSILIGAINAVLGGRAHKDLIRTGTSRAAVSAVFDSIPARVAEKLSENGYPAEGELLIKRDIAADGKGGVRINGMPATAALLKEITSGLIDIHGQQDSRILTDESSRRELIDGYAGLKERIAAYSADFRAFSALTKRIKQLEAENSEKDARIEKLRADIEAVEKLGLKKGGEAEISERLNRARNIEEIGAALTGAAAGIGGGDSEQGAADLTEAAAKLLRGIEKYVPDCGELAERLSALSVELRDISGDISALLPDEEEGGSLQALEEKMSGILWLKRKYGLETDEILDLCAEWKTELAELSECDNTLAGLNAERHTSAAALKAAAEEISSLRKEAALRLEEAITEQLRFLDMPDVRLKFGITQGKITLHGMDTVELMISVNKGEDLKPIAKAASGGELSRIMLAIKSVSAEQDDTPTMIFDEIDTGISGRAARKVGKKLAEIARKRQVLCVTHLAQIAALSDDHLLIQKNTDESRTYTEVSRLDRAGKIREVARLISGDDSEASLRSAEELIARGTADADGNGDESGE